MAKEDKMTPEQIDAMRTVLAAIVVALVNCIIAIGRAIKNGADSDRIQAQESARAIVNIGIDIYESMS